MKEKPANLLIKYIYILLKPEEMCLSAGAWFDPGTRSLGFHNGRFWK